MKLSSFQLESHLNQALAKVYVICGEDPFLVQETLASLQQKSLASGYKDRLRFDIETDADLETAYTHVYTPPFLSPKRLLVLHWKAKLTKSGQQFLINYAQQPSPHAVVLIRLGKLDRKTEQTQWFRALEKNSVVISIWPLPQKQLPAWLMQRAKTQNLAITTDAAELLAHYVEGNLHAAAQEIEKLSLSGATLIDRSLVETAVADQACFNAFDLVHCAVAGNAAGVLRILNYLKQEGAEPLLILGAFTHELRTLTKMAKDLKKGSPLSSLLAQYRIHLTRQGSTRDFLKRNSHENCLDLILKAGEIDRLVKGALQGNIWEALQKFGLAVAKG